jgi:hypothetical protein
MFNKYLICPVFFSSCLNIHLLVHRTCASTYFRVTLLAEQSEVDDDDDESEEL